MSDQTIKHLVCFDFDHTILDCNSDTRVQSLLPNCMTFPPEIASLKHVNDGWTEYMRQVFAFLHKNGVTKRDYYRCIAAMPLTPGFRSLFEKLSGSSVFELNIISDSNNVFIEHFLFENNLRSAVKNIITNPASFDKTGCLTVSEYQQQNNCKHCQKNMCKGAILEKLVREQQNNGQPFDKVIYIGDGSNDVCPALKLGYNDIAFARIGYTMLKLLKKLPSDVIHAKIVPWDNGQDIINALISEKIITN